MLQLRPRALLRENSCSQERGWRDRQKPVSPKFRVKTGQVLRSSGPQPEQPRQPQCVHSMIRPCNRGQLMLRSCHAHLVPRNKGGNWTFTVYRTLLRKSS